MERELNLNFRGIRGLVALGLLAACSAWVPNLRAVSNPVPYLSGLSPVTVLPGSSGFTLTVNGSNFVSGSTVQWNGTALVTTFVGSGQLTATVPASDVAAAGTAAVQVVSPGPISSNTLYVAVTSSTHSLFFRLTNQSPSAGVHPNAPVFGDFNNDGILDLAVSNQNTGGNVSIFFGNGNGSFQAAVNYATGLDPQGMTSGDFNGDGFEDLAVVNYTDSSITVLLGSAGGTFTTVTTTLPQGAQPLFLATADFNRDGVLDLAVACQNRGAGFVAVLLGIGDGTFGAPATYGNLTQPEGLALGDINQDGFVDVAVTDYATDTLWVFRGVGDGTFGAGTPFATAAGPAGTATGDFNGDGFIDVAVTDLTAGEVSVLLNSGGNLQTHVDYATASGGSFLTTGDYDGDGILDLAVASAAQNTFSVLLGNGTGGIGDGTFGTFTSYVVDPGATALIGLAAADTNGDGRYDFAFIITPEDSIAVVLQAPELVTNPTSLDFGSVPVGSQSSPMTTTLTNGGSADLVIYNITSTDPSDFPATSMCGTLPKTLHPGEGCMVSVTFTPLTEGSLSASVRIGNSGSDTPAEVTLTGIGLAAEASLAPTSLTFGNQNVGTTSASQPVTLSNTGNAALTITSIGVSSGYSQTNNCGSSLAAGSTCAINVFFSPTTTGVVNGTLTITDNSNGVTGSTQTASLTGTGVAPIAGLAPTSLTFGNQNVGTMSAAQKLTLSNTGTAALTITSIAVSGTNATDFNQTNACGTSLAAGGSCTINVTFTPSASGSRTATVTVTDNSNGVTGSTQSSAMTGTGVAIPVAGLAPASLTFSNQLVGTTSAAQALTLSNTGTAALTITSIALTGTNAADFRQTNTCGTSLAAGANCAINVTFTPLAGGTRTATVTVTDNSNGTSGSTQTSGLTGTGITPIAGLAPSSLTFASEPVGTASAAQALTLSNTGTAALTITSIALTGTNAADFRQTNTCGTSLAAGANCAIDVTFTPSAAGTRTATVTVTDNSNGTSGSTQTSALTGTGAAPAVTLAPTTLSFGDQAVGVASTVKTVTVTNSGNATLTLSSVTASGDFTLTNGCGDSLDAGKDCTLMVSFKPTATGTRSGTVTLTDNASPGTQTVALTGNGLGAVAKLSSGTLSFSTALLVGGSSAAQTLTLQNTGNAALTITSIAAGGDFAATNTCGASLAANATCDISVTFTPTAGGTRSGTLTLTDSASGSPQTVSLSGTGQDFALSATSTSATVAAGGTATYSLTLSGEGALAQAVSLSCAGAPSLSTCKVSPTSVTPSGSSPAAITVTVTTTGVTQGVPSRRPTLPLGGGRGEWLLVGILGLAGLGWLARRRPEALPARLRLGFAMAGLLTALALGSAACGGGGNPVVPGTPSGSYNLTVTGTVTSGSTTVNHDVTLKLTVN